MSLYLVVGAPSAAGGDRDIPVAIFGVKTKYLEASFDETQKQYGTIENYFTDALGIDTAYNLIQIKKRR